MIKIGIYGNVNVGKSSFLNYVVGQQVSIVSSIVGTTTDVVRRRFELPDVGNVMFLDTAGLNDVSALGPKRVRKTVETIEEVDLAIIIEDETAIDDSLFSDVAVMKLKKRAFPDRQSLFLAIKNALAKGLFKEVQFYGGLLKSGQSVLLVCPIDHGAPQGRLILPQVQAIRAALDLGAKAIVVQVGELETTLSDFHVDLVVTDSQVFDKVTKIVNNHNPLLKLTSFSILLADLKGDIEVYQKGLQKLNTLKSGDHILIIEYCSHRRSCDDIGHVKIPQLLNQYVQGECNYTFVTGRNPLPAELDKYALAIQCGGCMTNRLQIIRRIGKLTQAGIAITNYGLLLRALLTLPKS